MTLKKGKLSTISYPATGVLVQSLAELRLGNVGIFLVDTFDGPNKTGIFLVRKNC